jgi:hypothetical protein
MFNLNGKGMGKVYPKKKGSIKENYRFCVIYRDSELDVGLLITPAFPPHHGNSLKLKFCALPKGTQRAKIPM